MTTTLTDEQKAANTAACHTMLDHIGRRTVLGISGGRINRTGDLTIQLPIRYGWSIEVEYHPVPDVYEVRRVFSRGTKRWVKGSLYGLYWPSLPDVCWDASCYESNEFGGHRP